MLLINNSVNPQDVLLISNNQTGNSTTPSDVAVVLTVLQSAKIPGSDKLSVEVTEVGKTPTLPAAPSPGSGKFPIVSDTVMVTPNIFLASGLGSIGNATQALALGSLPQSVMNDPATPWAVMFNPNLGNISGAYEWWYLVFMDDAGRTPAFMYGGTWDPTTNTPNPPGAAVGTYHHPGLGATWYNGTDGTAVRKNNYSAPSVPVPQGFVKTSNAVMGRPTTIGGGGGGSAASSPSSSCSLWNPLSISFVTLAIVFFLLLIAVLAVWLVRQKKTNPQ